ncbi:hypothetical protein QJS10_CPA07g00441 [Acorus calamus]|uniref:Uncharacterized protein n=1 Tax=Acorus calamus TaxID=4465 RepID=A0AAV9EGF9_ACOCL|nr:hypothetical protein QJS10_CPA07g00441 [Acorus calamus]
MSDAQKYGIRTVYAPKKVNALLSNKFSVLNEVEVVSGPDGQPIPPVPSNAGSPLPPMEFASQQLQTGRATLEATQNALLINPLNPSLISSKAQAKLAFLDLLRVEESFLRQKSRQLWLSDCDKNSLFFHSMVKYRIARNSIRTVQLQDGSFSLNPSTIKSHTVDFFKALHNTQCTVPIPKSPPMISLSDSEQVALCVAVSDDEIKATLFSLKPLSSPGLDGMAGAREVHFDNGRLRIEA